MLLRSVTPLYETRVEVSLLCDCMETTASTIGGLVPLYCICNQACIVVVTVSTTVWPVSTTVWPCVNDSESLYQRQCGPVSTTVWPVSTTVWPVSMTVWPVSTTVWPLSTTVCPCINDSVALLFAGTVHCNLYI